MDQLCTLKREIGRADQVKKIVDAIKAYRQPSRLDDLSESELAADILSSLAKLPADINSVAN